MSKNFLDWSIFTWSAAGQELQANSIRSGLKFDAYESKTIFKAIALTDMMPMSSGAQDDVGRGAFQSPAAVLESDPMSARSGNFGNQKWRFKARILGDDSPHSFIPDPCNTLFVRRPADFNTALSYIQMHTTFITRSHEDISTGDDLIKMGDVVWVQLEKTSVWGYDLETGYYISRLNQEEVFEDAEWGDYEVNCNPLIEIAEGRDPGRIGDEERLRLPASHYAPGTCLMPPITITNYYKMHYDAEMAIADNQWSRVLAEILLEPGRTGFYEFISWIAVKESNNDVNIYNRGGAGDSPLSATGNPAAYGLPRKISEMPLVELLSYMRGTRTPPSERCTGIWGSGYGTSVAATPWAQAGLVDSVTIGGVTKHGLFACGLVQYTPNTLVAEVFSSALCSWTTMLRPGTPAQSIDSAGVRKAIHGTPTIYPNFDWVWKPGYAGCGRSGSHCAGFHWDGIPLVGPGRLKFDAGTQRLLALFLLIRRRPLIGQYIMGVRDIPVELAAMNMALEWESVGLSYNPSTDPEYPSGLGHHDCDYSAYHTATLAHRSSAEVQAELIKARTKFLSCLDTTIPLASSTQTYREFFVEAGIMPRIDKVRT